MHNNTTHQLETLLTYKEVAEILKVDQQTVRRQVNEGNIKKIKIGKSVKFEPQAIVDFIESCRDPN
jgi:excisionase family DNA binding protein